MIAKQAITRAEELKGVHNEPKIEKSNTEFFEDAPEMNRGLTSIPPKSPTMPPRNAGGVGPSSGRITLSEICEMVLYFVGCISWYVKFFI